jgi:glycosyltransferase involved in cell wall biosynthesis
MNNNILMVAYTNYTTDARVVKEAEAAVRGGYKVDFISLKRTGDKNNEEINGVNVIRLNQVRYRGDSKIQYIFAYWEFFVRFFFKSMPLFSAKKYRIVHVNNMPDFLVFSALYLKLRGAGIILDIHDPMPNLFITKMVRGSKIIHRLLLWQELLSAAFADKVLTVTEPVKDSLIKDGIPPEKITVVANFADDNLFRVNNGYNVNGQLRMIYHGTIAERWGLKKIILALTKIKQKEKFHFRIIGEGDYSEELKKLIKDNDLESIVCFDNKVYPFTEIGKQIKEFNLGIVSLDLSPATDYALSTKMVEYIATGLPVLTINNKAVNYYFGNTCCFFYDPDNIQTIVDVFNRLAEDSSLLYNKRNEVLGLREKFIWQNEKKKYLQVLNSLSGSQ